MTTICLGNGVQHYYLNLPILLLCGIYFFNSPYFSDPLKQARDAGDCIQQPVVFI